MHIGHKHTSLHVVKMTDITSAEAADPQYSTCTCKHPLRLGVHRLRTETEAIEAHAKGNRSQATGGANNTEAAGTSVNSKSKAITAFANRTNMQFSEERANSSNTQTSTAFTNAKATEAGANSLNTQDTKAEINSTNTETTIAGANSINTETTIAGANSINPQATIAGANSINPQATIAGANSINPRATEPNDNSSNTIAGANESCFNQDTDTADPLLTILKVKTKKGLIFHTHKQHQ